MKALIQKLVETSAPSGHEGPVRQVIRAEIEPLVDAISVDSMGNLIARRGKKGPDGLRIMLAAHMDEIGVIATHIDSRGFVRFLPVGGVRPTYCPGSRVRFLNGASGVIGLERLDDSSKTPSFEQMFIDLGCTSADACPVEVGDMAAFDQPFIDLGERLAAKSLDNRIGVAVLVEALRQLHEHGIEPPHEIVLVFTAQEEVGVRGATTAAYAIEPDLGIAVDITGSGDTPKAARMAVRLGAGPAIKVRDRGILVDPRVVRWMVGAAEKAALPYQLEVLERGGTDARAIQLSRAGVPTGGLTIPGRYVHSASEMVDYTDVQNAVRLLVELLRRPVQLDEGS